MGFVIISIITISIIGTLSHFLYEFSNHNKIVGLFTAVNESVWEHIKIALTPTFLWGIIDGLCYGMQPNYFFAKFTSLIIIIVLMPALFYGYKVFLKKEQLVIDVIIFYIVIISSQLAFYNLSKIGEISFIYNYLSCIGIFVIFGGYMIHTLMPAKSIIFKDPISNKYGYKGHTESDNHGK